MIVYSRNVKGKQRFDLRRMRAGSVGCTHAQNTDCYKQSAVF